MKRDEFWKIVEQAHAFAPQDMQSKCLRLEQELRLLPLSEVLSFEENFGECFCQAYNWDIWGAAFIIHKGCGDDGFMDFRSTLISLGRRAFEAALADADSLAAFDIDPQWACYEGYQYVASKVYRNHYNHEPPKHSGEPKHPSEPTGVPFDEEEMTPRFPRLVAKYGYKDTDPAVLKAKRSARANDTAMSDHVTKILLGGIIPKSGMVPPPRIVRQVLKGGSAPRASGLAFTWAPFELNEGHFWAAVRRLENASSDDLSFRPDLNGRPPTLDTECVNVENYEDWISSLKGRGLQ